MNLEKIPYETKVKNIGMPGYLEGDNGKAVLLLHGFTGLADDVKYLGGRLNQAGFTVMMPRLPGHGTNSSDFQLTGRRDWLRRSIDSYLELANSYETIYAAGISMGGLLTIILASMFPLPRIALAAPAIINTNKLIHLTPVLRFLIRKLPSSSDEIYSDPEREFIASEYWRWRFSAQTYELYKLQKAARRALGSIDADTLTLVSRGDRTVPPEAADMIEQGIISSRKKRIVLEKSPHVLVNDIEKERVADEIVAWFSD